MTKDEYGFWDDVVCANIELDDSDDKILEGDIVTYGVSVMVNMRKMNCIILMFIL